MRFFETTRALFKQYRLRNLLEEHTTRQLDIELYERLEQLEFCLRNTRDREDLAHKLDQQLDEKGALARKLKAQGRTAQNCPELRHAIETSNQMVRRHNAALFELRLFTEAFYFFAGRLTELLSANANPFPGFKKFDPQGIRDVRNRLIQHPEKGNSRALSGGFGYGGTAGPTLKVGRSEGQPRSLRDKGLYVNAEEFREKLDKALRRER